MKRLKLLLKIQVTWGLTFRRSIPAALVVGKTTICMWKWMCICACVYLTVDDSEWKKLIQLFYCKHDFGRTKSCIFDKFYRVNLNKHQFIYFVFVSIEWKAHKSISIISLGVVLFSFFNSHLQMPVHNEFKWRSKN